MVSVIILSVVMLNVVMVSVAMLNVVTLNVLAPIYPVPMLHNFYPQSLEHCQNKLESFKPYLTFSREALRASPYYHKRSLSNED
jgi:hypothetical protein